MHSAYRTFFCRAIGSFSNEGTLLMSVGPCANSIYNNVGGHKKRREPKPFFTIYCEQTLHVKKYSIRTYGNKYNHRDTSQQQQQQLPFGKQKRTAMQISRDL